jgi:hypothetical protein
MKKIIIICAVIIASPLVSIAQSWPAGITAIASVPNDSVVTEGNLSTGKIITDLSWASSSSNACFTGLQFKQYMGNLVFFGTKLNPGELLKVYATPDNPVEEISLYGYMLGENEIQMVPNLSQCITCEADYKRNRPMKGKTLTHVREMEFRNPTKNTYNIIIGVSAPKGVADRKFSLMIKTVS